MTIYQLAASLPPEQFDRLDRAGILSKTLRRDMQVFERFAEAVDRGLSRMDAYAEVSRTLYVSEENARKIIRRMSEDLPEAVG